MAGILLFVFAAVLLAIGVPIAASLGLASLLTMLVADINTIAVIQKLFAGIDSVPLLAVPFFILAGELMNQGGIAQRIVKMAAKAVGNIHGGFGIVAILSCMFFAAISGSAIATAAAIGSVMMGGLLRAGYSRPFAATIVAAASPLGIIIPPSIAFIIYAVLAKVSVADLYKVGFPAGIIVALALVIPTVVIAKKRNYRDVEAKITAGEIVLEGVPELHQDKDISLTKAVIESLWALGTPIIIVGGVFASVFTPTESAIAAVAYSIVIGLYVYKEIGYKDLGPIFFKSAVSTASIMIIMASAALFAWVMVYLRVPQNIINSVLSITADKYLIMLVINLIVLIAGMFMESGSIQYILVPIALPLATQLGIDPIHFGIVLVVNLSIGMLTPPFGVTLFTTTKVFDTHIQDVTRETMPYLGALIGALMLMTYFPQLVMWIV